MRPVVDLQQPEIVVEPFWPTVTSISYSPPPLVDPDVQACLSLSGVPYVSRGRLIECFSSETQAEEFGL